MTRPARADRLWLWYLLAAGTAAALVIVSQQRGWTAATVALYLPTVAAGAIGIVVGMIRHRPRAWVSWLLVACSQAGFGAGSTAFLWFFRLADPLYLAMDVCLVCALVSFVRSRVTPDQPAELLDAAIITTGVALMAWLHLIEPLARVPVPGTPLMERVVGMAYPLLDLLMFVLALRLALAGGRRPPAYYLIMVGLSIYWAADIGYCYLRVTSGLPGPDALINICPLIGVILIGAAGLHPSMTQLDERPPDDATTAAGRRIAFLGVVSLIAPAELLAAVLRPSTNRSDMLVITGAWTVLVLLILTRMAGLVIAHRQMAVTDPLTGLATRRVFGPALDAACARAGRRGTWVGVMIIDVDHFKEVNDTYGHDAGDQVLREVARRLRSLIHRDDIVARLGGEEFAILAPDTDPADLADLAGRLRAAVHATPVTVVDANVESIRIAVSIGVAGFPTDATTGEGALQAADRALYAAKQAGRNRVVIADLGARQNEPATVATAPTG